MRWLQVFSVLFLFTSPVLAADTPASSPEVWMMPPPLPDGRCLREMFTQPDLWKETRSRITVLGCWDHYLNKQYKDDELRAWLPMIDKWGLKFALEVGAVKPWGTTGKAVFDIERPMWERFRSLGGRIYAMAMDEPLFCVRNDLKKSAEYAVEETAQFVALVRKHYPDVRIGDIEPYPAIPLPELIAWIDALQARLEQMNVRGLDFFRLDVDWVSFTVGTRGNWQEVRKLEEACHARKIPFSLIYWAADYEALERLGLDLPAFLDLLGHTAIASDLIEAKGPKMVRGDFTPPQARLAQHRKDVSIILEYARKGDLDLPLSRTHLEVLDSAIAAGDGDLDNAAVIREIRRRRPAP